MFGLVNLGLRYNPMAITCKIHYTLMIIARPDQHLACKDVQRIYRQIASLHLDALLMIHVPFNTLEIQSKPHCS